MNMEETMRTETVRREWISYREAMELTGLGRTLLSRLVNSGTIPAAKVNARVLISRRGLEEYLEHNTVAGPKGGPNG